MSLLLLTPRSFLSTFGWGDEGINTNVYYATLLPLLLVGAYVSLRWLLRHWASFQIWQKCAIIVLTLQFLANLLVFISFNMTMQYQPTGRYLYMALFPLAGFLSIAILAAPGQNSRLSTTLLIATLVTLNALTILGYLGAGSGFIPTQAALHAP